MTERTPRQVLGSASSCCSTVVAVAFTVPLPAIVSAIPFPDLPDVPAWAKWAWRGVVIGAIVLAVIGEVEKERSSGDPAPTRRSEA